MIDPKFLLLLATGALLLLNGLFAGSPQIAPVVDGEPQPESNPSEQV